MTQGSFQPYHNYSIIWRFDRGNKEALSLFDEGDVAGLVKAAHPLVSVLLHCIVKNNINTHDYNSHDVGDFIDDDSRDYFGINTDDEDDSHDIFIDTNND